MPAAADVKPGKWSNIRVLFDNGWYSVIAGEFEGDYDLGQRWNGDDDSAGFPSQGGHPTWHVVPKFLARPILLGLQKELARTATAENPAQALAVAEELERWPDE